MPAAQRPSPSSEMGEATVGTCEGGERYVCDTGNGTPTADEGCGGWAVSDVSRDSRGVRMQTRDGDRTRRHSVSVGRTLRELSCRDELIRESCPQSGKKIFQ